LKVEMDQRQLLGQLPLAQGINRVAGIVMSPDPSECLALQSRPV
jgi:hypothetical protein